MSDDKRKYIRLEPAVWAEIRAIWATGEATLSVLSEKYGVSTRALQLHFDKEGTVKGSQARAIAASVEARVFEALAPDEDETTQRAIETRERAYRHALVIEDLIMDRLDAAAKDPSVTFSTASALKSLALAAQALERLHSLKRVALGLSDDSFRDASLPTLQIADLSGEDIREMRRAQEEQDADAAFIPSERRDQSADEEIVSLT